MLNRTSCGKYSVERMRSQAETGIEGGRNNKRSVRLAVDESRRWNIVTGGAEHDSAMWNILTKSATSRLWVTMLSHVSNCLSLPMRMRL